MSTLQEQVRERALALGAPFGLVPDKVTVPIMSEDPESVKGLSVIARRLAAASFAIRLANALLVDEDDDETRATIRETSRNYGVDYDMTQREISLLHGDNTERDIEDVKGSEEAMAVVAWALNGGPAPVDPTKPSDIDATHNVVIRGEHIQKLMEQAELVPQLEVAALIDLYRLYAEQGIGDQKLVRARRVALEWFLVRENDWLRIRF